MEIFDISKITEYREGNRLEAKKASNGLPHSLWDTYSSFANTDGGIILLGVNEDKQGNLLPVGVKDADKYRIKLWRMEWQPLRLLFSDSQQADSRLTKTIQARRHY